MTGGTVNGTGSFIMEAERGRRGHLLAQIVEMVAQAQRSRAPIQGLADKVSGYFVPAVIAVAPSRFSSGPGRSGAAPRLCHRQRGGGADHRVPLRAGPGDADVDHGRRRPRRASWRPDP